MPRVTRASQAVAHLTGLTKRWTVKLTRLAVIGLVKFSMYCCISLLGFVVLLTLVAFGFTVYSVIRYGRVSNNQVIDPAVDELGVDQNGFQYETLQRNPMFMRRQQIKQFYQKGGQLAARVAKPYGDTQNLIQSSDFIADDNPFAEPSAVLQDRLMAQPLLLQDSVARVSLKVTDTDAGDHLSPQASRIRADLLTAEEAAKKACYSSHRGVYANPFAKVEYRIIERSMCNSEVSILLFVQSHYAHLARRQLIRNTYGSLTNVQGTTIRLVFIVALPDTPDHEDTLARESAYYRDIIVGGFPERKSNMLLKNFLALHWIVNYCPVAQYAVKLDDDTFLDIVHLTNFLRVIPESEDDFLYCAVTSNRSPVRRARSRWYVPYSDWVFSKFPPFCQGFGYVLSRGAAARMLGCSQSLQIVRIDDVYFTGVVAKYAKLQQIDFWKGHSFVWMEPSSAAPPVLNDYIFFASKNNVVQDFLWKRAWKAAVTRYY